LIREAVGRIVLCVASPSSPESRHVSLRPPAAAPRRRAAARRLSFGSIVGAALSILVLSPGLTGATAAASASSGAQSHAAGARTSTTTNATTGHLEGIDVSHWQGTVNWTKVAAAGKSFVFIKATESTTYTDPQYATNRAGAQSAGLWTGAYHFARPDATANDAILEADHFVATVRLGRGDLLPVLDLEQSGGLSVSALQSWAAAWLGEVSKKLGIRPMIYSSPYFWQHSMGDSSALADAGYKTFWVAHWGAASPTVPAKNWGGHGWTFWQYTDCGVVPGISGCVDLDRYNGTDLMPQAYSIFSLSAAAAGQVKQGQQAAAAATVGIARTNFPDAVALGVTGLPAGASASFDESPTTHTATGLRVTTDAAKTPTGTYPLTITGTGQGLSRATRVSLVVADGVPPTIVAPTMWLEPNSTVGSTSVPVYTVWSASDPSGIASYGLQRSTDGGTAWTSVSLP
jgi:lysozyme